MYALLVKQFKHFDNMKDHICPYLFLLGQWHIFSLVLFSMKLAGSK